MNVEIRPPRPDEYAAAGALTADSYREYAFTGAHAGMFDAYLERIADIAGRVERTVVLIALVDGAIAGSTTLEIDGRVDPTQPAPAPDELHIRMLGIDAAFRGHGIGRAMMEATLAIARDHGRSRVTLHTGQMMVAAQHLYESMGFRRDPDTGATPDGGELYSYTLTLTHDATVPSQQAPPHD